MKTITYTYRGQVERGMGNHYEWRDGFSETSPEGHPFYPWLTHKEALHDAKCQGAVAAFERTSAVTTGVQR